MKQLIVILFLLMSMQGVAQLSVTGPTSVCTGSTYTYEILDSGGGIAAGTYVWFVDGVRFVLAGTSYTAYLTMPSGSSHVISVRHVPPVGSNVMYYLNVTSYSVGTIGANGSTVCSGTSVELSGSGQHGGTFDWEKKVGAGSWTSMSTGSMPVYESVSANTMYRLKLTSPCGTEYSNEVTVNVYTALSPGSIGSAQTICYSATPSSLTSSSAASGSTGSYSYQWQSRAPAGSWSDISAATSTTYSPGALTATTEYRRKVSSGCSTVDYSNTITITVYATLQAGSIGSNQTICYGSTPSSLTSTGGPSGGDSSYTYQWETSTNGSSWSNVGGATSTTYSPGTLTSTTYYRRKVSSCGQTVATSSVLIQVNATTVGGSVSPALVEAYGVSTETLTLSGHTGSVVKWQKKEGVGSWTDISSTSTSYGYVNVLIDTDFRAVVKSGVCATEYSAQTSVIIYPIPSVTIDGPSSIAAGSTTSIVTDDAMYSYQWMKSGVNISGATTRTLTVRKPGAYSVKVKTTSTSPVFTSGDMIITSTLSQQNINHIVTTEFLVPEVNVETDPYDLDPGEIIQSVQYVDGLGRDIQTVSIGASPLKKDMIQAVAYDPFGRTARKYLPYARTTADGRYVSTASIEQAAFYQLGGTLPEDERPFSETIFEASPLNKPVKEYGPGEVWSTEDKFVRKDYFVNSHGTSAGQEKIIAWKLSSGLPVRSSTQGSYIVSGGYYGTGHLLVDVATDEHGNQVRTYTDKQGRVVLKKVQAVAGSTNLNSGTDWALTYYIYDVFGNMRFVLPPELSKTLHTNDSNNPDQPALDMWAFQYNYDSRKRMVTKKVPGAGTVYMVYDKRDRLVLTQDGNQRKKKQWSFSKYDTLNRPVMTGIYMHADSVSRATMVGLINTTEFGEVYDETEPHGYTTDIFPITNLDVLTATYYDTYDFRDDLIAGDGYDFDDAHLPRQETTAFDRVQGLVTGSKVNVLGTNDYLWNVNYYDDKYKVIQVVAQNLKDSLDRVTNIYDFVGKVMKTKTSHHTADDSKDIMRTFDYDHTGRLLETWHRVDSEDSVLLVKNEYNELGQIVTKGIHSRNGEDFAQQMDYRYNIRGWLTGINEDASDDKLFSFLLKYADPTADGGEAQYNGNISETIWRMAGGGHSSFGYDYDAMNRLTEAAYFNQTKPLQNGRFNESIKDGANSGYDLNGNIKKLQRAGQLTATTYGSMDNLTYTYTGNQVTRIDDAVTTQTHEVGFKETVETANEYTYDANGSMTKDQNKGITQIKYNHLNLPRVIKKSGADSVVYTYDAAGRKLKQRVYGVAVRVTDYAGVFIYENDTLRFINHEEGRILSDTSDATAYEWEYQYHLKDHLGNVRLTFSEKTTSTTYLATMELAAREDEAEHFLNYEDATFISTGMYNHTPAGTYSVRLSGVTDEVVGPARSMEVNAGDVVDLEVYARYANLTNTNSNMSTLLSALVSAFSLNSTGGSGVDGQGAYDAINGLFTAGPHIGPGDYEDSDEPKAYLNYILFDENFALKDFGFDQVSETADGAHEYLSLHVKVKQKGYLYIYLSNENNKLVDVFFDDFKIIHHTGVEQSEDYYPFGLTFNSYQRENAVANQYKFNGMELQDELNLGWLDYGARMYMPEIGRWGAVDPLSEKSRRWSPYAYCYNNPLIFVDLDGMFGDYFDTKGGYLGNDGVDDNKVYEVQNTESVSSNSEGNIVVNNNVLGGPEEIGVREDFLNMNGRTITSDETKNNLIGLSINMKNEGTTEGYETINVTGGDRTGDSNANANGSNTSRHLSGDAADIAVDGMSNKDLTKAAAASGLFSSKIYYPNYGDTGNFGTHEVKGVDAEGKPTSTQVLNFQSNGPHAHVDNGPKKSSAREYTGHTSTSSGSGTYKKLD